MATVDKTGGDSAAVPMHGLNRHFRIKKRITCVAADIVDANVLQCLPAQKDMIIDQVRVKIVTPAVVGTSLAAGVGDGDSGTGYDAAIDLTAAAGTEYYSAIGTDAYAAYGKRYGANDTIDLTLALTGAVTTPPVLDIEAWGRYTG